MAAGSGLIVGLLRRSFDLPTRTAGLGEIVLTQDVDTKAVPKVVAVSAVSLFCGASLGPEAAISQLGAGAGKYLAERQGLTDEAKKESILSGVAGAFGGMYSSPLMASMLVTEIAMPSRNSYGVTFLGNLVASTVSLGIYFAVAGTVFLGMYEVPEYTYQNWHLLAGMGLGVFAALLTIATTVIGKGVNRIVETLRIPTVPLAVLGGLIFGSMSVMLPLTNFTGTDQLASILAHSSSIGLGLLFATLLGKMFTLAVSSATGFVGGKIFPAFFIGGISGIIVHLVFPEIPIALAFSCMLAAVPGALGAAPFSLVLIAALLTQIGTIQTSPVVVAVATAFLTLSAVKYLRARRN